MNTQATRSKKSSRPRRRRSNHVVTKKQLSGGKFTPPTNPPDVTYQPWIPITLVISFSVSSGNTKGLEWKVSSIDGYLRAQVDPTKRGFNQITKGDERFVVQYRLISIAAWNLTGRVIALAVDDFTDATSDAGARDQLVGLVDTGTSVHTPAVGYTLPYSHQNHVLRTDDKQGDMNLFDVTTNAGQCVVYVKVLYRFDGPIKHPSIISPAQEIERVITKISNRISKMQEPSKMEIVMNGIKYVAEAVAVINAGTDSVPSSSHATARQMFPDPGTDIRLISHTHDDYSDADVDACSSGFDKVSLKSEEPSLQDEA